VCDKRRPGSLIERRRDYEPPSFRFGNGELNDVADDVDAGD